MGIIPTRYFETVASELTSAPPIPGLWARSFAESEGDINRARALYLRYRAQEIWDSDIAAKSKASIVESEKISKLAEAKAREANRKYIENIDNTIGANSRKALGLIVALVGALFLFASFWIYSDLSLNAAKVAAALICGIIALIVILIGLNLLNEVAD